MYENVDSMYNKRFTMLRSSTIKTVQNDEKVKANSGAATNDGIGIGSTLCTRTVH